MTKKDLQRFVIECLDGYVTGNSPNTMRKENIMKRSELKYLVNEIVRQCVKEAGPQYKVRNGKSYVEQPGKVNRAREIQSDPEINESEGDDVVTEPKKKTATNPLPFDGPADDAPENGDEHVEYDEQDEIRLLKAMGQAILVLLKMHRGMEEPEMPEVPEEESDVVKPPFGGAAKNPNPPKEDKEEEDENDADDEDLQESNHKVQTRTCRTIKDVPQNPENIRNPKVP